jgi:hypothetical protein
MDKKEIKIEDFIGFIEKEINNQNTKGFYHEYMDFIHTYYDVPIFDYIPLKYDWHKNKNTLRYKHFHYKFCKNDILECNRNFNKEEIPVTTIDKYFDDNFINSTNGYSNYQFRPLNKDFLWTNIENDLEDTSIQTIKKWNPEYGVVCKTFNVPVKKYVLKDNAIQKELTWLKWNNQYYDPNHLYTFVCDDDDISIISICKQNNFFFYFYVVKSKNISKSRHDSSLKDCTLFKPFFARL